MSTYILVHGSWIGGWIWEKVGPMLEQAGHTVVVLDLPGHGQDRTPVAEISLQSYTDRVASTLAAQAEPAILVGHSMGGSVISQVAEAQPDRVALLVYLGAFLLNSGESVFQTALTDAESLLVPNLRPDLEHGVLALQPEGVRPAFFNDCSEEDTVRAISRLRLEPLAPASTPIVVTADRYGRVPRVYIETLRDQALSPTVQQHMYTAQPCRVVLSLDAGHMPFFSQPDKLVSHLATLPTA